MIDSIVLTALLLANSLPKVGGVDGHMHDLLAEAQGRPLAVVFISHDCPICNTYAPEFARIARAYAGRIQFDIAYAEPDLDRASASRHALAYGLKGAELLLDPLGKLAKACGATITPEAAVLDANGRRVYLGRIDDLYYDFGKQRTAASRHDFRHALDAALMHRPATPASGPPFGCVIEEASK